MKTYECIQDIVENLTEEEKKVHEDLITECLKREEGINYNKPYLDTLRFYFTDVYNQRKQ